MSVGLTLVGYYQACERLDETALAPVGERVASKIKESFKDAFALVVCSIRFSTLDGTHTVWCRSTVGTLDKD